MKNKGEQNPLLIFNPLKPLYMHLGINFFLGESSL